MAVVVVISLLFFTIATTNGRVVEETCRKQIAQFNECKMKIYGWDENLARNNASNAQYKECLEKNDCIQSVNDLPQDVDWRKRKCADDVSMTIKQKVVSCVRLRVSPEFELPGNNDGWAYGRFSYEWTPMPKGGLEKLCQKGNYNGSLQCYMEVMNRTMMDDAGYTAYYEKACQRRAECFKLMDETCTARYNEYRQSWCDCAYDVHELYGGKRLLTLMPSCAGLIGDQKIRLPYKERDSCLAEDQDARDSMIKICKIGYPEFKKELKLKQAQSTTSTKSPTTPSKTSDD